MRSACATLPLLMMLARPAAAYDFAVNAGAVEVVVIPERQHLGFYPYLGFSLVFPLRRVTLIPQLTVEAAAESGHWGFVLSLVADFQVQARLGLDVDVTVLHDQLRGDLGTAEFLVGAGVGFSVFVGRWTISPYLNLFRDLSTPGWALVPGINLAATK
jgi:hypothetical protein